MRFLVDECLSFQVARLLADAGHDAVHIGDLELLGSVDEVVMATALAADRVLISADTDFGTLLALSGADGPSVIVLRREGRRAEDQAALLLANMEALEEAAADGSIVVIGDDRMRIRSLPIIPKS